jgi:hypothetical protein
MLMLTRLVSPVTRPPRVVLGERTVAAPRATHSGHWKPTDADRMQSGQIGRSHRVHRIQVSRSGWR